MRNAREAVFAAFRLSAKTRLLPNLSDTNIVPNGVIRAGIVVGVASGFMGCHHAEQEAFVERNSRPASVG